MSVRVIVLNGQGASGKDTFKQFIKEYNEEKYGSQFFISDTSMVERVKFIAQQAGWHGGKDNKDRLFLHDLKILLEKYNDLPYESVKNLILKTNIDDSKTYYIFVDARESKDIERLKEEFDCTTVLVVRNEPQLYGNAADDDVFNFSYDYVIDNSTGLDRLRDAAETFWEIMIQGS